MQVTEKSFTNTETALLVFLWRWKLSTTACLSRKFFPRVSAAGAYQRLWLLEKEGLIRTHCDSRRKRFVWTLDQKGYKRIRQYLDPMCDDGFRSEHMEHDLLVSAVHLGEWLIDCPEGVDLFSEQELRRIEPSCYPRWVPQDREHRPDGYWNILCGSAKKTVALEVELSRQTHLRYATTGGFYARNKSIVAVLWVVRSLAAAELIAKHVKSPMSKGSDFHAFAMVDDFCTHGWQAPIVHGAFIGSTIEQVLKNSAITRREPVLAKLKLDMRKAPHKSKTCADFSDYDFCI